MRLVKRMNELFIYLIIIISGYLILTIWYYISKVISWELVGANPLIIGLINTFTLPLLLSLMVYLLLKVIRKFNNNTKI
ncbi:MAG: hypothetical protein ACM34K_12750 [Bacillota bacterium]